MSSLMNLGGGRSLFDEFFRDFSPGYLIKPLHGDPLPAQIKVDIKESEKAFTVHAELPGVGKDDIHVSLEGGIVTISAEVKQQDTQTKDEKMLRSERYYGMVSRSFQLPKEVDTAAAAAKCENGVLVLTLPKKTAASTKRITVE
ncbi:MAG: Hsp20/alpha crystallin family protein [Gammaproteobacteria bacterium]